MSNGKTIFHITLEREKTELFWSFLTENFEVFLDKEQHSVDKENLNVYISVVEKTAEVQLYDNS